MTSLDPPRRLVARGSPPEVSTIQIAESPASLAPTLNGAQLRTEHEVAACGAQLLQPSRGAEDPALP